MGFIHRLNPFRRWTNASTLAQPEEWLVQALCGALASAAGVPVTPLRACGVSTVFACVNRISGTISSVPLKLYRQSGDRKEPAIDHPLYALLHDAPTSEMTSAQFRRAMQANLSLRSAAYAFIVRDGLGAVAELRPILPCDIQLRRDLVNGPLFYYVRGQRVEASSILPLRGFTHDGVCPIDLVATVRDVIGLAIALQDNAAKFFANGSRPGAILEHPASLSADAAKRLRESFERLHKGSENAHRVAVLEEGLKYVAQSVNNKDSQFQEARAYQDEAICRVFGVPQIKAGITTNAHFNNVEQENQNYVTDTILPICAEWEQSLGNWLLTPAERRAGYYFKFVLQGMLRGDIKSRFEAYRIAIGRAGEAGWMCPDEARELEDMNPIPDGEGKNFNQASALPLPSANPATA